MHSFVKVDHGLRPRRTVTTVTVLRILICARVVTSLQRLVATRVDLELLYLRYCLLIERPKNVNS